MTMPPKVRSSAIRRWAVWILAASVFSTLVLMYSLTNTAPDDIDHQWGKLESYRKHDIPFRRITIKRPKREFDNKNFDGLNDRSREHFGKIETPLRMPNTKSRRQHPHAPKVLGEKRGMHNLESNIKKDVKPGDNVGFVKEQRRLEEKRRKKIKELFEKDLRNSDKSDILQGNERKQGPEKIEKILKESHGEKSIQEVARNILGPRIRPEDSVYKLNVSKSDVMSLDRDIPETRPNDCKVLSYNISTLPTVSVIIPIYQESLSMLLRCVHSILNRSPASLIKEIILVDDNSKNADLKEPLDRYVKLLDKVRILRPESRQGLIKARMLGARQAAGDVLMFQDAHTEVNVGWLEPILAHLKDHPNDVVQPTIDEIHPWTLEYSNYDPEDEFPNVGAFKWDFTYVWMDMQDKEKEKYKTYKARGIPSPTLVGCALAMDKRHFFNIGGFDEGLKIWGAENIELAWRVWMCSGSVLTLSCSRVGHVFKPFSYGFDGDKEKIVAHNVMRVSEIWMGPYKKYTYSAIRAFSFKRVNFTDEEWKSVVERKDWIQKTLQCKSFQWYLETIFPEVNIPPKDSDRFGEVSNAKSGMCLSVFEDGIIGLTRDCFPSRIRPQDEFSLDHSGQLKWRDKCVTFDIETSQLYVKDCRSNLVQTYWYLAGDGVTWGPLVLDIYVDGNLHNRCLTQVTSVFPPYEDQQMTQALSCKDGDLWQEWVFSYKMEYSQAPVT